MSHPIDLPAPYEAGPALETTDTLIVRSGVRRGPSGFRASTSLWVLRPELVRENGEAFLRAATGLAAIVHAAAPRIEDVVSHEEQRVAVLAPLSGAPLARFLEQSSFRAKRIAPRTACRLVASLSELVHALGQALGGALGGVSSEALWVEPHRRLLLMPSAVAVAAALAQGRYRAPEAMAAREPGAGSASDPRVDVHALGLLLWDLLALGRATVPELTDAATEAAPPSIDARIVRLVMACVSVDPSERPADALSLARELQKLTPESDPPRSSGRGSAPSPSAGRRPEPRLRILGDRAASAEFGLGGPLARWVVGRSLSADLPVCDPDMSRRHFEIVRSVDGAFRVRDLGSKNGLLVNGAPADARPLSPGDELRAGTTSLCFER